MKCSTETHGAGETHNDVLSEASAHNTLRIACRATYFSSFCGIHGLGAEVIASLDDDNRLRLLTGELWATVGVTCFVHSYGVGCDRLYKHWNMRIVVQGGALQQRDLRGHTRISKAVNQSVFVLSATLRLYFGNRHLLDVFIVRRRPQRQARRSVGSGLSRRGSGCSDWVTNTKFNITLMITRHYTLG